MAASVAHGDAGNLPKRIKLEEEDEEEEYIVPRKRTRPSQAAAGMWYILCIASTVAEMCVISQSAW